MPSSKSIVEQHKAIKTQVYDILENRKHHAVDSFISAITAMNACSDEGMRLIAEMAKNQELLESEGKH